MVDVESLLIEIYLIHHNQSKMRDDGYDKKSLRVASKKQMPFLLLLLSRWSKINASTLKYKVWKVGQSEEHAIPLNDAINLSNFTCKVREKLKSFYSRNLKMSLFSLSISLMCILL
ncbi:hypothetical protein PVL29_003783 [Vitis rotundifolia]|uniref:Uncharacterized protein n=1 Tax=Vitis rotundifolia TaxID=103349 RepID=A0AA39E191_VITRO|nr:hypothetical protein PVL29_003783 [Vitis rotundifolia]